MPTCPHCGFEAERGSVECPLCGTRLSGGVATADTTATTADRTPEGPIPWEDPDAAFFEGLWRTWKESLFEPEIFFSKLSRESGFARPVLYLLIVSVAAGFISLIWVSIATTTGGPATSYGMAGEMSQGSMALVQFFLTPFAALIWLGFATVVLHLVALFLVERPRSIGTTARALCYVAGPNILVIVPFIGWLVGVIWWVVLNVIAMRETHRTSTGRAVLIFSALPILLLVTIMMLVLLASIAAV